jgi:hypothetical protein
VPKEALDRRARRIAIGSGLSLGAVFGLAASAQATDYTVDRIDDPFPAAGACVLSTPNDCTLRGALIDADSNAAADRVLFQSGVTGTVTLSSQGLSVTHPVDIVGPGANVLAVSGGNGQRVFDTEQGTVGDPVTISGLTLTAGYGSGNVGGGAIYSKDTYLTIESSTISNSTAGQVDEYVGGAIHQVGDELLVRNSTISGNKGGNGGGIDALGADVGILSSTISGNTATGTGSGSGYGYGGGVWLDVGTAGGSLVIYDSTISGNHAYDGGGITSNASASGTSGIINTVVANNTATAVTPHRDLRNAGTDPFELAHSLVESPAGASIVDINNFAGSNILGEDPQLGALAANGGPTQTLKPSLTSPVLDKGLATLGFSSDQRGEPRPFDIPTVTNTTTGDAADIGAVELQASDFVTGAEPTPAPPQPSTTKKKCKKKKHKRSADAAKKKKCKKKKKH